MSTQIEMPELSSDGQGVTLATWLVSVGDRVEKGDVIAELETDKATVELEAPAAGTIVAFVVEEGAEGIMPGTMLARLEPDASIALGDSKSPEGVDSVVERPVLAAASGPALTSRATSETVEGLRGATPLARRAAQERDVDLSVVPGSGPGGRVVEQDVLRAVDSDPGVGSAGEAVRADATRKTIARRMSGLKEQNPHFHLRIRCSLDAVLDSRAQLNRGLADAGRDTRISVDDFIIRAAGLALRDVPDANVGLSGDAVRVVDRVDISVAIGSEPGLRTLVVRDVDCKGLAALADEIRMLTLRAREGKLGAEQTDGGTFAVSNLGTYGVESVYPILTPPQTCILGVGAAEERPIVRNGAFAIGRIAMITLAADPRAIDETVGAKFLAALRELLEEPLRMML